MYLYLVVLLFVVIYYVTKVRSSRLYEVVFQYPPGRKELPLLGSSYHFLYASSEHFMKLITDIGYKTMEAGGITRLYACNTYYLVLTDASDIAEVLSSYLNKNGIYNVLRVITGKGSVFVPEHSISKVRRHAILPLLNLKLLSRYIESIWAESVSLTEVLAPYVGKGPFVAGPYVGAYCFNSIIRWAETPQLIEEECTLTLLNNFHRCFRLIYERMTSLWMLPDLVYKYTANHDETQKHFRSFQDFATKEVIEEAIVMTGASEEAGVAIGFALMLFGQYPAVQDRVYEELVNIFGESDRTLDKEDLVIMPYLDLYVKEVLRLYPPVPVILRQAHKEIKLSSGRVIPEGAGIVVPIISLHRHPAYWGPDAEHFDPERFLPERLATVPDNAYMPFSYGPRSCVGGKLANFLVKLALCAILRRYKVVGTPAAGPVPNIRIKFEVTLKAVNNYKIELVKRI